jgi:membrane-associated HD superfamily phosphohydrolase
MQMTDIRRSVEEDRGILKKIQSVIPGYAGYRRREDIRQADSQLRTQMADRLHDVRAALEESRRSMVDNMVTEGIEAIGSLINKTTALEGRVRHAEQGYSGFSAAIRIEENELNRLYEYDYAMVASIQDLMRQASELKLAVDASDAARTKGSVDAIRANLTNFTRAFEERIPRIAGIYNMG